MRGNQTVEVVATWACFHSRRDSKVSLEIQLVAIMRWSSEERVFALEAYFFESTVCDCNPARLSKLFQ